MGAQCAPVWDKTSFMYFNINQSPLGLFFVKFQLSSHILSMPYSASQPKIFFALSVLA